MFEKSDEKEKDKDFKLDLSDNEEINKCVPSGGLADKRYDVTAAIYKKPCELTKTQIEKALMHDPPDHNRISSKSNEKSKCSITERITRM